MHEWPILIFTLSVQASVGLCVILICLYLTKCITDTSGNTTIETLRNPLSLAFILAAIGLAAAFWHLGYPFNAPNAIRHFATSWLSREIILSSVYIGLLGCIILALYFKKYTHFILPALLLAGLIGIVNIYCMAHIYRATSILTWKSINTHILFFGSCLNIGGILALCWLQNSLSTNKRLYNFSKALLVVMAIYAFICLLYLPAYITFLQTHPYNEIVTFPIDSVKNYFEHINLQYYHFILLTLGLVIAFFAIFKKRFHYLYLSFIIIMASEIIARYAFYYIHA